MGLLDKTKGIDLLAEPKGKRPDPIKTIKKEDKSTRKYIRWSVFDTESKSIFEKITAGEEDVVRPSVRIPESRYSDVKSFLALKRQTFQEYVWALILEDLHRNEKSGAFVPPRKQLITDENNEHV